MPKIDITESIITGALVADVPISGEVSFYHASLYHIFYKKYDPVFDRNKQFHLFKAENKTTKGRVYVLQLRKQDKGQIIDLTTFARKENPPEKLIIDGDIPDHCILRLPRYCPTQIEGNLGECVRIISDNTVTVIGNVSSSCLVEEPKKLVILGRDYRSTPVLHPPMFTPSPSRTSSVPAPFSPVPALALPVLTLITTSPSPVLAPAPLDPTVVPSPTSTSSLAPRPITFASARRFAKLASTPSMGAVALPGPNPFASPPSPRQTTLTPSAVVAAATSSTKAKPSSGISRPKLFPKETATTLLEKSAEKSPTTGTVTAPYIVMSKAKSRTLPISTREATALMTRKEQTKPKTSLVKTTPLPKVQNFAEQLQLDSKILLDYVEKIEQEIQKERSDFLTSSSASSSSSSSSRTLDKYRPMPHQLKSLKQLADAWAKGKKTAVFELATGTGKTNIMINLQDAISIPGSSRKPKMLFLVPLVGLIDQTIKRFQEVTNGRLVVMPLREGRKALKAHNIKTLFDTADVVVATIQTFCSEKGREYIPFGKIATIVIDEAHTALSVARSDYIRKKILQKNCRVIAVTATPFMEIGGERTVYELMGFKKDGSDNPIIPFGIQDAILEGVNAPVVSGIVYPKNYKKIKVKRNTTKGTDFNQKELERIINRKPYNQMIVNVYLNTVDDKTKQPLRGKRAIIFCGGIEHAKNIAAEFNKVEIDKFDPESRLRENYDKIAFAHFIYGEKIKFEKTSKGAAFNLDAFKGDWPKIKEDRYGAFTIAADIHSNKTPEECTKILLRSKLGGCIILTGANKLIEGYDDPEMEVVIRAVPTLSSKVLLQSIGRVLRTSRTLTHKIAYVLEIGWGGHIDCKYFNDFLRDRSTLIPRYSLGAVDECRKYHSPLEIFKESDIISLPEAYPIESVQWEPKLVENMTIQRCLDYLGPALRKLKDKVDVIKGLKESVPALEHHLWTFDTEKSSSASLRDPKQPEKKRKTRDNCDDDCDEDEDVSDEAGLVDEAEDKDKKSEEERFSSGSRKSRGKKNPETTITKRFKKMDDAPKEKQDKKTTAEKKEEDEDDARNELALSYTDRVVDDNVDKARDVLQHIKKTLAHKVKRTFERKSEEEDDIVKKQRDEKIKSIEEKLESVLKRYQEINEKLDVLIKAGICKDSEQEKLRQQKLADLFKQIDEIDAQFQTVKLELEVVKKLDQETKTLAKKKTVPGKKPRSPDKKLELELKAKKWVEAHPETTFIQLFNTEELPDVSKYDRHGVIRIVKQMILSGNKSINLRNKEGEPTLFYAKSFTELKLLVEKGRADINAANSQGETILHHYAKMFYNTNVMNIVSYLISRSGINIDAQDIEGNTPLHLAIQTSIEKRPHELPQLILFFLAFGAKINITNAKGITAEQLLLMNAASILHDPGVKDCKGHKIQEFFPTLPSAGGELTAAERINLKDYHGLNCLYYAIWNRSAATIKRLINKGVNPETLLGANNRTAIFYLFERGIYQKSATAVIKFLLDKKVNVNLLDSTNRSPLSSALKYIGNTPIVEGIFALLKATSLEILCHKDDFGEVPFHIFMRHFFEMQTTNDGVKETQKKMLSIFSTKAAICLSMQNNDGNTPFHLVYSELAHAIETCVEEMGRRIAWYRSESSLRNNTRFSHSYYHHGHRDYQTLEEFITKNDIVLPKDIKNKKGQSIEHFRKLIPELVEKFNKFKIDFCAAEADYNERSRREFETMAAAAAAAREKYKASLKSTTASSSSSKLGLSSLPDLPSLYDLPVRNFEAHASDSTGTASAALASPQDVTVAAPTFYREYSQSSRATTSPRTFTPGYSAFSAASAEHGPTATAATDLPRESLIDKTPVPSIRHLSGDDDENAFGSEDELDEEDDIDNKVEKDVTEDDNVDDDVDDDVDQGLDDDVDDVDDDVDDNDDVNDNRDDNNDHLPRPRFSLLDYEGFNDNDDDDEEHAPYELLDGDDDPSDDDEDNKYTRPSSGGLGLFR